MGEQHNRDRAAAALRHFFHQAVAQNMPRAFERTLHDAPLIAGWLQREVADSPATMVPVLDQPIERFHLDAFGSGTLLCLMLDRRQLPETVMAARDILLGKLLADEEVQAAVIRCANAFARQAVQDRAQDHEELRDQVSRLGRRCIGSVIDDLVS